MLSTRDWNSFVIPKYTYPCLHLAVEVRSAGSSVILRSARKLFYGTAYKRIQIGGSGQQFFFLP
jgi:hypothetical protein